MSKRESVSTQSRRTVNAISWLAGLCILLLASASFAQTFPKLNGRVVDAANVLSPEQETALTAKLVALERDTTRQFVVATVPDLQDYDISEYGYKLGDHWKIGQKGENNGIILLIAPNERRVRIEVGPGLEGIVPDVLANRIIRNDIVPRFKAGDYPGGISIGADKVIALIKLPPGEASKRARISEDRNQSEPDIGAVIFWLFIFFFFILPVISPLIFGRGRRGRRFGGGPVIIWGGGSDWGGGGSSWGSGGGFGDGGGFSGGGGSFGGGGSSGSW
jgi:uncharacterized protein